MKTIKQVLIILFFLLLVGRIATNYYFGSAERLVPPEIYFPAEMLEVSAADKESALLQGMTATDAQDGDITNRITVCSISNLIGNNTAKVTYVVFDSDNNMASCVRRIRYTDYRRPTFSISKPLVFSKTDSISILPRLEAHDVVDGDLSDRIRVSTQNNTSDKEIFMVAIQVTNSIGDTSILQVPVLIQESNPMRPEIRLKKQLVYLENGSKFEASSYIEALKVPGQNIPLSDVSISSDVNTEKPGTYYVYYSYASGNSVGTSILTVVVQ
jgi:hypothetical protein